MLEAGQSDIRTIDARHRELPAIPWDRSGSWTWLASTSTTPSPVRSIAGFDEAGRFRPSPIQARMVEAGRLGRKTGRGFYRYDDAAEASRRRTRRRRPREVAADELSA